MSKIEMIEQRKKREKALLLENLRKIPIVHIACEKSGVSTATYYRWRKEDEEFSKLANQAISEGEGLVTDMSESQLIQLIKERKFPAVKMWLQYHHPKYESKPRYVEPKPDGHISLLELAKLRDKLLDPKDRQFPDL